MYKVKRFSTGGKTTGSILGAGIGASIGKAIGRSPKAQLIGAGVGAAGGLYLGHKLDKAVKEEDKRVSKTIAEMRKYRYPTKNMEKDFPSIVEFGGLPDEYYLISEICKKSEPLIPNWGDGDEYQIPMVTGLNEVNDALEDGVSMNEFHLIRIGFQDYGLLAYNFDKHKWIDLLSRNKSVVNSVKKYVLDIYYDDLKMYKDEYESEYPFDEMKVKEVIDYYEMIIKLIKSSRLR